MTEGSAAGSGQIPHTAVWETRFDSRDIGAYFRDAVAELLEDLRGPGRGISWAITLIRSGEATTLAAGSAPAPAVDALEGSFDDGPARSAVRSGEFVLVADTSLERRWPGYGSAAVALGIGSVLSVPLVPPDMFRAVINLYASWPHVFTSADITAALRFVRHTSRTLQLAQHLAPAVDKGAELSSAQLSRALAGLALRTLIREYGFSSEAALEYLRSVAGNFSPGPLESNLHVLINGPEPDRARNSLANPNVRTPRCSAPAPWADRPYRLPRAGKIIGYIDPVRGDPVPRMEAAAVSVYSLGIWLVHPGRENDFMQAWRDLARKTEEEFPHAKAVLMHDRVVHNRFISTGPWESIEQIDQWRASSTYTQGVEVMKDLLEHFEPHTLDEAASIGWDTT